MDTAAQPSRGATLLGVVLLLLSLVPIVLWPLETCFCIDEPQLLSHAGNANAQHSLYITGLFGNFGIPYGPLPTHIYQAILAVTHDPATIVILRALLCSLVTGLSLLWMARSLGLPQWFAAAFLFSPYVSEQMRVLWDASFTVPIGTLALASLASFVKRGGKWPLRFALAAAVQMLLIHPQSIPLAFPIIGCLFWKYRPALRGDLRGLIYTAAVLMTFNFHYFLFAFEALKWKLQSEGITTAYPKGATHLQAAMAPLLGGNIFNGVHALPSPAPDYLVTAAKLTKFMYGLIWLGIAACGYRAVSAWRAARRSAESSPLQIVCTVAFAGFVLQGLLYGALRIPSGPQYFFGTFALHAFFAWVGVATVMALGRAADRRMSPGREGGVGPGQIAGALPGVFALGVAGFLTTGAQLYKHEHRYDAPMWPTLEMASDIVRELNRYDSLGAYSDIDYLNITWFKYPQAIRCVRLLQPPGPGPRLQPKGPLFVTFQKVDGKTTGKIEVVDLGTAPLPEKAYYFGTAPLTELWFPDPSTW